MSAARDLLGFGIVAVDDLVELARFPQSGQKQRYLRKHRQGGGITGTALVAAARIGARCGYAGLLGDNELANFIREGLVAEGIEVLDTAAPTAAKPYHSIILVEREGGERTILDSNDGVIAHTPGSIRPEWIAGSRGLFLDWLGLEAGVHAATIARAHGIPVFADMESVGDSVQRALLALVDHLIVPLQFARTFTGEDDPARALAALSQTERACTAVTDGPRGCWFCEGRGTVLHQPAFPVTAVDTTGCGDVFHGAYAAAILQGRDVAQTIRFAAAAAALKATQSGGQAGIPNRAAVEALLG